MQAQGRTVITPQDFNPDATPRSCQRCGARFVVPFAFLAVYAKLCDACADTMAKDDSSRLVGQAEAAWRNLTTEQQRAEQWAKLCPPTYRETEPAKLPRPDLLARVMRWQYGWSGLLLHGETGLGKSRCAWQLVKREFETGRKIEILNHSLAFTFMGLFAKSPADAEAWVHRVSYAPLVLMDDCFKAKLTEALEAALFSIIATRGEYKLPTIATLNDTAESLKERLSSDRGDALLRRLRETSEAIAFVPSNVTNLLRLNA